MARRPRRVDCPRRPQGSHCDSRAAPRRRDRRCRRACEMRRHMTISNDEIFFEMLLMNARTRNEITVLQNRWPEEFKDGFVVGLRGKGDGERDKGGYPPGF